MREPPLSPEAWSKIVQLYQSGEMKISALAERFGRNVETIRHGLAQRKVITPSGQLKRKNSCGMSASTN
jgi:transposase-like protein